MTTTMRTIQRATLTLILVGVGVSGALHSMAGASASATGGASTGEMPAMHGTGSHRPPCLPCPMAPVRPPTT